MCPNRVEELESRVQELEASVGGLTDELVECKVRLRELENAVDRGLGFTPELNGSSGGGEDETSVENESAEETKSTPDDAADNAEESSEIIVA